VPSAAGSTRDRGVEPWPFGCWAARDSFGQSRRRFQNLRQKHCGPEGREPSDEAHCRVGFRKIWTRGLPFSLPPRADWGSRQGKSLCLTAWSCQKFWPEVWGSCRQSLA
jgi:hypothetical protein